MSDAIPSPPRGFTWHDYTYLLKAFLNSGYIFSDYADLDPEKSHVILRHDIDFSLEAARDIARIEADMGIVAHYFILLRTEFYNVCSPSDLIILEEIRDLGHEIGLHFDAAQYDNQMDVIQKAVRRECEILETIVSVPVKSISFHRPAKSLQGIPNRLADRMHAYQPQFFSDISYFSDSQGAFRFGHPLDSDAFRRKAAMQLLTHPIWWTREAVSDRLDLIDRFLEGRSALLRSEAAANCKPYATRMSEHREVFPPGPAASAK